MGGVIHYFKENADSRPRKLETQSFLKMETLQKRKQPSAKTNTKIAEESKY